MVDIEFSDYIHVIDRETIAGIVASLCLTCADSIRTTKSGNLTNCAWHGKLWFIRCGLGQGCDKCCRSKTKGRDGSKDGFDTAGTTSERPWDGDANSTKGGVMPYIREWQKASILDGFDLSKLLEHADTLSSGEINYIITKILLAWIGISKSYGTYNSAIGILECAKLELYRRQIAPYEDKKREKNGDV